MSFSPRQVVAIVWAIAVAVVLAPVGVLAASGQLVTITGPGDSGRKAVVSSVGALQVESRPGVVAQAQNVSHVDVASLSAHKLYEWTGPTRVAVSEVTATVRKSGSPVAAATIVDLVYFEHESGENPCGGSGWERTVLRRFTLATDETLQLDFDGPPLIVPKPASGQLACVAMKLYQWAGDTRVDFGATVYPIK